MRLPLLIALAILPWLAISAQAGGYRHHHHHHFHRHGGFGHHGRHHHGYHGRHHHRFHGWHHYRHHHRYSWRGHRAHVAFDRSVHDRSPSVPEGRAAIYAMVTRSAVEHGLPPSLAHGIVRVESGYRCNAYNAGAAGIMQVKAATARSVGVSGGLRSCRTGLEAGMRYLRQAYEIAHGNAAVAATLYNRGLYARPRRSGYSRSVMRVSSAR